ncbi:MAG TPA: SGNH/GDSL hydrolase family protein, partial [Polyangiaceae bacterium]
VGDSISCGYGNEGTSPDCRFSAETENHYLSYGAILARRFGAELSTVAWSGRGVVKNYNGQAGDVMPVLYDRALPETSTSTWQPSEPYHAVIVNLGTNDFSTEPDPEMGQFVVGYVTLLATIRAHHPKAFVLCTIGPMLGPADRERAEAGIAAAVAERNSAGDRRIEMFRMRTQNDKPGCDWHPGLTTHQRIAAELAVPLRHALDW